MALQIVRPFFIKKLLILQDKQDLITSSCLKKL